MLLTKEQYELWKKTQSEAQRLITPVMVRAGEIAAMFPIRLVRPGDYGYWYASNLGDPVTLVFRRWDYREKKEHLLRFDVPASLLFSEKIEEDIMEHQIRFTEIVKALR